MTNCSWKQYSNHSLIPKYSNKLRKSGNWWWHLSILASLWHKFTELTYIYGCLSTYNLRSEDLTLIYPKTENGHIITNCNKKTHDSAILEKQHVIEKVALKFLIYQFRYILLGQMRLSYGNLWRNTVCSHCWVAPCDKLNQNTEIFLPAFFTNPLIKWRRMMQHTRGGLRSTVQNV